MLDALGPVAVAVVGLVGVAVGGGEVDGVAAFGPRSVLAAGVLALPAWWRRRAPSWSLLGLGVALAVAAALGGAHPTAIAVAVALHLYALGAWSPQRRIALGVVAGLTLVLVVGALADSTDVVAALTLPATLVVLPAAVGHAVRSRRLYVAEVEQRLADAENDRDVRAREAVVAERIRIARELHDVVAHHVSLIGVQAGAARTALDHDPAAARSALASIEDASRLAVGEMRRLLGLLDPRPGIDPPQPGLEAVPALVGRWRDAGLDVDARLSGDPSGVAPVVSACCYRIVEEAVTNSARHSGARHVGVVVDVGPVVTVEVHDPGPAVVTSPSSGGRGITGMRERVALCGGRLEVGPTPGGGFAVRATVPAVPT